MCLFSNNGNDGLSSFFATLLFLFIIFAAIAMLAIYVSIYILYILLIIAGIVGIGYALYIYGKEFASTIRRLSIVSASTKTGTFFKRWFFLFKDSCLNALIEYKNTSQNAYLRSKNYRLISPRRWYYFLLCIMIMLCGIILILMIILANLLFIIFAAVSVLAAAVLFFVLLLLVDIAFFAYKVLLTCLNKMKDSYSIVPLSYSNLYTFNDHGRSSGEFFKALGVGIRDIWSEIISGINANYCLAKGYFLFSPPALFYYISPIAMFLWGVVYTVLFAVLCFLFYIGWAIGATVWILIRMIFKI